VTTSEQHDLNESHPGFTGRIGVARRDITPPVGIYSRMWGSAVHDVAEGIHRPLTATVLALCSLEEDTPQVLISLDLGWWRSQNEEELFRSELLKALSLSDSQLILHLTHTHSGPSISLEAKDKLGGEKIEPYLHALRDTVMEAAHEALSSIAPATLEWSTGRCDLARFRDQPNPDGVGMVVGYCPDVKADDTLLVGRVSCPTRGIIATLVNYACHPTTLGGANGLISPDYVGALRDLVEDHTANAPCLFLNGAAGDLAPRQQYVGDPAIADANGRQLGYAVLSVLSGMLPARSRLKFMGVEESGAKLGRWEIAPHASYAQTCRCHELRVCLSRKKTTPLDELQRLLATCNDQAMIERLERKMLLHRSLGEKDSSELSMWIWQLGNAFFIGFPGEMHSPFQLTLREHFPETPLVVMNLVNGTSAYLPPRGDYALDTYQASTSLFEPGCHEQVLAECTKLVEQQLAKS